MARANVSDPPSDGGSVNIGERLDRQGLQIREAAKWLIGSFAAVGAALIAGSQLSSIGKLPVCTPNSVECARLWIAGGGAVGALMGVMWAVWTGVQLLAPRRLQVSDLKLQWKEGTPIYTYFRSNPAQLQGFTDLDDMEAEEGAAYARFDELNARSLEEDPNDREEGEEELDAAQGVLTDILRRSDDVVAIANHVQYVHFFRGRALRRLVAGAGIAALGIVAFSWAANPPTSSPSVALRGANLSGVDLTGVNLRNVDLSGAILEGADLTGADLQGADLEEADLSDVVWSGTTCPDGSNSDNVGGSCENHL